MSQLADFLEDGGGVALGVVLMGFVAIMVLYGLSESAPVEDSVHTFRDDHGRVCTVYRRAIDCDWELQ